MKSSNTVWHHPQIDMSVREKILKQKSVLLWFTGLSGSGKSTLANAVEAKLAEKHYATYLLDGDNIRHGLNGDLGFSQKDRKENIRRVGELATLFVDAGLIVLTAFISPFRGDRQEIRKLLPNGKFIEIFTDCPVETCEKRDVKGLYQKARRGEITDFTGVSSPYETPVNPEISVNTKRSDLEECVDKIIKYLEKHKIIEVS